MDAQGDAGKEAGRFAGPFGQRLIHGMVDSIVVKALALLVGSTLAALLYEAAAGNESFSLPFATILLVVVVGTALSVWWGWGATLSVLGVQAAYSIIGGLIDRRSRR